MPHCRPPMPTPHNPYESPKTAPAASLGVAVDYPTRWKALRALTAAGMGVAALFYALGAGFMVYRIIEMQLVRGVFFPAIAMLGVTCALGVSSAIAAICWVFRRDRLALV